jgi:hypothetical protein
MLRTSTFGLVVSGWLLASSFARADVFAIDLEVRAGKTRQTAHAETVTIGAKRQALAVLEAKSGERIVVKWTLRNVDPKATVKDVVIHFYAARSEKLGQNSLRKLDKDVLAESALTMDFKPKDKTEGELSFTVEKPGVYLVRLETMGAMTGTEGSEYFAALNLVVR